MANITILPQSTKTRLSQQLGQSLGQGVARNFPTPEQNVQKGLLSEAFKNLKNAPESDYLSQLEAVAPTLLTTAGGAEALGQIAPILSKKSENLAIQKALQNKKGGPGGGQSLPSNGVIPSSQPGIGQPQNNVSPQNKFRHPSEQISEDTTYPNKTAGPQIQKIMSPQEIENFAVDLMKSSSELGKPISFSDAYNMGVQQNQNTSLYNDQILKEQDLRKKANEEMSSGVYQRALNSGLVSADNPEEKTVIDQLAYKYRNEATPADQWEKVRTEFQPFAKAREAIRRESSIPGPFQSIGRKIIGTYKDKESLFRDLQPSLDKYRQYGLFDAARNELTSALGMGAEDAERALFPFTKEQKQQLSKFPSSPHGLVPFPKQTFPGDDFGLDGKNYEKFKENLGDFLEKNKGVNLISLRGDLNQSKRYDWNDISKAIGELIEERRFTPDLVQSEQLPVINQAPLPGLAQIFDFWWKKTK